MQKLLKITILLAHNHYLSDNTKHRNLINSSGKLRELILNYNLGSEIPQILELPIHSEPARLRNLARGGGVFRM